MKKSKAQYRTTPKPTNSEDTLLIEESAIDTFLLLSQIGGEYDNSLRVQFHPDFLKSLAVEIEELKRLRDQILQ